MKYSRSRNGKLYDYFYCLGRQRDPRSCDFRATRVGTVEQRVVDHYRDVQLPPSGSTRSGWSARARWERDAKKPRPWRRLQNLAAFGS